MIDPISQLAAGARIRALRKYAKWSQRDMAKFLNTDRELISRWERGLNYPSWPMTDQLCNRFQITTDYIFRGRFEGIAYEVVEKLRPLAEQELARLSRE